MQSFPGPGERPIGVLVADDSRIHTQLLSDALRRDHGLEVISANSPELAEAVRGHKIDVVVLSSNLDGEPLRGFEVLRQLRASNPDLRAIMLLDSSKRETIVQAFCAGAKGIFSRYESVESLAKCIRSVHQGQIWANSQQMSYAVEALAAAPTVRAVDANGLDLLSKRELEVVRSLAEGLSNREIAQRLGLSQHTIKNYLFRVFDKLGVSSRLELLYMTLTRAGAPESAPGEASENEAVSERFASPSAGTKRSQTKPATDEARPAPADGAQSSRYSEKQALRLREPANASTEPPRSAQQSESSSRGIAAMPVDPRAEKIGQFP